MNCFTKKLLVCLFAPFHVIGAVIPVRKNIWVFGSGKGKSYSDNSRALFEYVHDNHHDVRAIWLTRDSYILNTLRKEGYEAYMVFSVQGAYYGLIAGSAIFTVGYADVGPWVLMFPWKKKILNLWHGTPLKRIDDPHIFSAFERIATEIIHEYLGRKCDLVFSSTEANAEAYAKTFGVKPDAIKVTGQPRNDKMVRSGKRVANKNKLNILYLPTWREYDIGYDLFQQHGFEIEKFDKSMKAIDAIFYVKLHPNEMGKMLFSTATLRQYTNIRVLEGVDLYDFLSETDVLITDYSSVYFDFLLLGRPIIFTPFDLEKYEKLRGLYYDYGAVTPGPKARSWNEVIVLVEKLLKDDNYEYARNIANLKFNYWRDDKSSERVYRDILDMTL